ncbi:MAG: diacylglycerol kinase family protein [Ruminococcus sp.]|nr:diacylglycerol kinase family protein [Ruminococcus sp.]
MNKKNIPLLNSFLCAIKGVIKCFLNERNFRIHLCVCFYVIWLGSFYSLSNIEKAALAIVIGLVIVAEVINTAIENLVDFVSPEKNIQAGLVKDISASAVLISAVIAVVVGFFMFWDIETLKEVFRKTTDQLSDILLLAGSVLIWLVIIFYKKKDSEGIEKNEN